MPMSKHLLDAPAHYSYLFPHQTASLELHRFDSDLFPLPGHARRYPQLGVGRGPCRFRGQLWWCRVLVMGAWWLRLRSGGVALAAHPRSGLLELIWVIPLNCHCWINGEDNVCVYQKRRQEKKRTRSASKYHTVLLSKQVFPFTSCWHFESSGQIQEISVNVSYLQSTIEIRINRMKSVEIYTYSVYFSISLQQQLQKQCIPILPVFVLCSLKFSCCTSHKVNYNRGYNLPKQSKELPLAIPNWQKNFFCMIRSTAVQHAFHSQSQSSSLQPNRRQNTVMSKDQPEAHMLQNTDWWTSG